MTVPATDVVPPDVVQPARILIVCTANACRSPSAELITTRTMAANGRTAIVTSAGTRGGQTPVHRFTLDAAHEIGIDLSPHQPRQVTRRVVEHDGHDLVVTMTRQHMIEVLNMSPDAAERTFTLPELARLAAAHGVDPMTSSFPSWISALHAERAGSPRAGDVTDDVPDPYGGPRHGHRAMVAYVAELTASWISNMAASTDPDAFKN